MRVLLSNKKMRVGIIATLVGVSLLLTSLSFAWFTAGGDANPGDVEVGSIRASLTIDTIDPSGAVYIMGPGYDSTGQIAKFQSTGTLDTLTRFKSFCNITIKSDGNGNRLDPSKYYPAPANQDYVTVEIMREGYVNADDPTDFTHPLGLWLDAAGDMYLWGLGSDGNIYLSTNGNRELYFAVKVIVADNTPKDYMDAEVHCGFNFLSGQLLPDRAVPATFGINNSDIDWDIFGSDIIIAPITRSNPIAAAWAKIDAMPDSAAKTILADRLADFS